MENKDNKSEQNEKPSSSINCTTNKPPENSPQNSPRPETWNIPNGGLAAASPPKFVSLEEIVNAASGMKNMALAHEIALDKNFQLQKLELEEGTLHKKVKDIVHKAFWDLLTEQLSEDPPNYSQALVLFKEIRETLEELVLPHHKKIRENIREVLDIDLIKQQAEKGVLDFDKYARYVLSIMSKVCAPVRDQQIEQLAACTNVIETFQGILDTLQLMRLDLANFTITMMRPNIVASSVEYEKGKFAEFLKIQADGLQHTRKWLLKHFKRPNDDTRWDPNDIKQRTFCLLAMSYLDLLEWDFHPDAETLMLDQGRLLEIRDKTSRLSVIGSILLIVSNTIGGPVLGVASFKNNMKKNLNVLLESVHSNKDLEEAMPNIVLQVKKELTSTLKEVNAAEMTKCLEDILDGQLLEVVKPDHKIRSLIILRIRQFLYQLLISQSTVPQKVPLGLSSLQEELTDIAAQFLILVSHNRSVFGEYYIDIVTEALNSSSAPREAETHTSEME